MCSEGMTTTWVGLRMRYEHIYVLVGVRFQPRDAGDSGLVNGEWPCRGSTWSRLGWLSTFGLGGMIRTLGCSYTGC